MPEKDGQINNDEPNSISRISEGSREFEKRVQLVMVSKFTTGVEGIPKAKSSSESYMDSIQ